MKQCKHNLTNAHMCNPFEASTVCSKCSQYILFKHGIPLKLYKKVIDQFIEMMMQQSCWPSKYHAEINDDRSM